MSNGIGKRFFLDYLFDIFPSDFVVSDEGTKLPVPRYYYRLLELVNPFLFNVVKINRLVYVYSRDSSRYFESLYSKYLSTLQRISSSLKRNLDFVT